MQHVQVAGKQQAPLSTVTQPASIMADKGHIGPVSARELQGSRLMRQAVDGDSTLLLGGDLMVSIREVCCTTDVCPALQHLGFCLKIGVHYTAFRVRICYAQNQVNRSGSEPCLALWHICKHYCLL